MDPNDRSSTARASDGSEAPGPPAQRSRPWLAVLAAWAVWGAIYAIYLRDVKEGRSGLDVLRYAYSDALIWALATPLVFGLTRRFPVRSPRTAANLVAQVLLAPAVAFAVVFVDAGQDLIVATILDDEPGPRRFVIYSFSSRLYSNILIYASLVAIGHWLDAQRRLRESERSLAELRAELAEARLHALESQVRPHFLFNCLNTIAGLVESRPAEARERIGQLARLLRSALRTPLEQTVPLEDELEFVVAYVELEKARFEDRLRVTLDVADDCWSAAVPPILLQPLVENAVRHGIAPLVRGGNITLQARRREAALEITVEDDGVGLGVSDARGGPGGIGLASVRTRLTSLYGTSHELDVADRASDGLDGSGRTSGTRVRLVLPFEEARTAAPAGEFVPRGSARGIAGARRGVGACAR